MATIEQICYFVKHSCLESLKELQKKDKVNLNFNSLELENLTPLQFAAAKGDFDLVEIILSFVFYTLILGKR